MHAATTGVPASFTIELVGDDEAYGQRANTSNVEVPVGLSGDTPADWRRTVDSARFIYVWISSEDQVQNRKTCLGRVHSFFHDVRYIYSVQDEAWALVGAPRFPRTWTKLLLLIFVRRRRVVTLLSSRWAPKSTHPRLPNISPHRNGLCKQLRSTCWDATYQSICSLVSYLSLPAFACHRVQPTCRLVSVFASSSYPTM